MSASLQRRAALAIAFSALTSFGTGCAGARTSVVAPTAAVPISFSRAVRDERGALVGLDRREVVGTLDADGTAWGMLYSGIRLTPELDVSDAVNQEVQRLHGDAVVNLTVATRQCVMNWVPVANVLPMWPGCANVHIHGDIIRVRKPAPAAAAVAVVTSPVVPAAPEPNAKAKRSAQSRSHTRRTP